MRSFVSALALAGVLAAFLATHAAAQDTASLPSTIEWSTTEVTIVAKAPGPAMWKLTRGASTVWVLGFMEQTPRHLAWDDRRLRHILTGAHALIVPGKTAFSPFAVKLWGERSALPGGETLRDVVSSQTYQRFRAVVDSDPELDINLLSRISPIAAGNNVHQAFREDHFIVSYEVLDEIEAMVEAKSAKVVAPYDVSVDYLSAAWPTMDRAKSEACLVGYLDDIDWDLHVLPAAAQAWATGDIATLEKDYREPPGSVCGQFVPQWQENYTRYNLAGMTRTIENALKAPGKTIAIVPFNDLLRKDGVLDRLRAEGIDISSPAGDESAGTPVH